MPEAVVEGETFTPRIRVSQEVIANFIIFISDGSAVSPEDFQFSPEFVKFGPTNSTLNTSSPVSTFKDNKAEPDEQFTLTIELVSPFSFKPYVTINNPTEVVTIIDTTSECDEF